MKTSDASSPRYTIDELAQLAGVTRRTVRYYVSRGLLPPPEGLGRGPHYTQEHLLRLEEIRNRQLAGESLEEIEVALNRKSGEEPEKDASENVPAPSMDTWTRVPIFDGVELHLRGVWLSFEAASHLRAFLQPLLAGWLRRFPGVGVMETARPRTRQTEPGDNIDE